MKFVRDASYTTKLVEKGLYKQVIADAKIEITAYKVGGKYKAFCPKTDTYIQFPRHLRVPGAVYVADLYEQARPGVEKYYTAVKGSIRRENSQTVVA